jgi:hypothetical protein
VDRHGQAFLNDRLLEANRVLIVLALIDVKVRHPSLAAILHDSVFIYTELLSCQHTMVLSNQQSAVLRATVDHLGAHLRFFGEDV